MNDFTNRLRIIRFRGCRAIVKRLALVSHQREEQALARRPMHARQAPPDKDSTRDDMTSTPSGITDPVELLQRIATTAGEVQRQETSVSADRLKPLVVELDDTLRRLETLLGKISSL